MQQEPHGSCGSLVDPLVSGSVKHPVTPARRAMVRPGAEGRSGRGGQRERKPPRRFGDDVLRRGLGGSGTTAVEPGWTGSSVFESAELSTSYSSEFEAAEHRGRKDAAGAATHHGLPARKSFASENPRSGSGPSVSAKAGGRTTRRGGEKPRGRYVPGEANPGDADPSADVAEGAGNPRRGDPVLPDRRGQLGLNPERATKPAGAAGRSSDRSDGRMAEFLVVVETTRRRRRTNRAATPFGALREAGQP